MDWDCTNCGLKNYNGRKNCLKCNTSKEDSNRLLLPIVNDGSEDIGAIPYEILLLRGLKTSSNENEIFDSLVDYCQPESFLLVKAKTSYFKSLDKFDLAIGEKKADSSRSPNASFGFLFFKSIELADVLLNHIYNPKNPHDLSLEESIITVTYASRKSFLPGAIREFVAFRDGDIGYCYWDETFLCISHPVDDTIPALPLKLRSEIVEPNPCRDLQPLKTQLGPRISKEFEPSTFTKWSSSSLELNLVEQKDQKFDTFNFKLPSVSAFNQSHTDYNLLRCLLCRRKFSNVDAISHHFEGRFHQQRRRIWNKARLLELHNDVPTRANITNTSVLPLPRKSIRTQYPTRHGIKADNIGNRMLSGMGWHEGTGLGRGSDGILKPLEVVKAIGKRGVGSASPRRNQKFTPKSLKKK